MKQYLDLAKAIVNDGTWIYNERTGKNCKVLINYDLEYDVENNMFPLLTTRKSFWKSAVAELIGYLRGYDSAAQFRALGTNTWNANANENEAWLNNPYRRGTDDMGWVYGAVARNFPKPNGEMIDTVKQVIDDLTNGIDNRSEIITFYHPGLFDAGCLKPCMYSHHFSLVNDDLYLNTTQRSCDVPLGLNFNMVQAYALLAIVAQITGKNPKKVYHKIVNAHVYEDQYDILVNEHLPREPSDIVPTFHINKNIKTLEDLETWVTLDDFCVGNYHPQDAIKYPFSV